MSFDQLMEHAREIQAKAIKHAYENKEATGTLDDGGGTMTYPKHPYENGVESYYADIPSLFEPFAQMPDPAKYQPMIDVLHQVMGDLCTTANTRDPIDTGQTYLANPELGRMKGSSSLMPHWDGLAAQGFKKKFLDPFEDYTQNQFTLVAGLKSGLEAHQAMWQHARDDIDKVAHATIDALDNAGGCDKNTWNITFTVLSAIATVAVTFATEGVALPLALNFITAATSVASTMPPGGLPDQYSGETAQQITDAMKDAMKKINDQLTSVQQTLTDKLTAVNESVAQNRDKYFVAPRPDLADQSGSTLDGNDGVGEPH